MARYIKWLHFTTIEEDRELMVRADSITSVERYDVGCLITWASYSQAVKESFEDVREWLGD